MARKRATIEERMERLRLEIRAIEAGPSSSITRRTLAGKRAALSVMEQVRARGGAEDYCKGPEPIASQRAAWADGYKKDYLTCK